MNVALQTSADINGNGNGTSLNPLLEGLLQRGVNHFYHFNSVDVRNGQASPVAKALCLLITRRNGEPYNLVYTVLGEGEIDLSEMDLIFIRGDDIQCNPDLPQIYSKLSNGTLVINSAQGTLATKDKFDIPKRFSGFPSIKIPETYCTDNEEDLLYAVAHLKGDKVVAKYRYGHGGKQVVLLDKKTDNIEERAKQLIEEYSQVVVQEYIPSVSEVGDIRAVTFKNEVIGAYNRRSGSGMWHTNMTCGGRAQPYSLTREEKELCSEIASSYPEVVFNSIDITRDGYLLETNAFPTSLRRLNLLYGGAHEDIILNMFCEEAGKIF